MNWIACLVYDVINEYNYYECCLDYV